MKALFLCTALVFFSFTNQALAKEGLLLVMFGTSYESAKVALTAIEQNYRTLYGNKGPIEIAYTSDFIRKKLKKQGQSVHSIDEAMHALAKQGVTHLTAQSLHVTPAAEYNETERLMVKHLVNNPKHFATAKLGAPLLVSAKDMHKAIDVVLKAIPAERGADEAVVFMGHGNNHGPGDLVLMATAKSMNEADNLAYLACVEGALNFDNVLKELQEKKIHRVWLMPFMIVAGDHAVNDLAGPEADSWASQLQKAGFDVKKHIVGLGELQGIRDIFLTHTQNAHLDVAKIRQED